MIKYILSYMNKGYIKPVLILLLGESGLGGYERNTLPVSGNR